MRNKRNMSNIELINSEVVFLKEGHTYWKGEQQLSGITSLLDRQLFPDKYIGVSSATLDRAKDRGTKVHEGIEWYDALGEIDPEVSREIEAYQRMKASHRLLTIANEYLVSDNDYVASSIDVVFDDCSLADIKTTSSLNEEYVSWQLSIYAYLFELQNPGKKVPRLLAIWLPKAEYGKPKLVEVERKPSEWCAELIACDKRGEQYVSPVMAESEARLALPGSVVQTVIDIERELKRLQGLKKELQTGLLEEMKKAKVKTFKGGGLQLIYKEATTRQSIDTKLLQEKYPEIYDECLKESEVKESITIKI